MKILIQSFKWNLNKKTNKIAKYEKKNKNKPWGFCPQFGGVALAILAQLCQGLLTFSGSM